MHIKVTENKIGCLTLLMKRNDDGIQKFVVTCCVYFWSVCKCRKLSKVNVLLEVFNKGCKKCK
jgi:hypothetical protein